MLVIHGYCHVLRRPFRQVHDCQNLVNDLHGGNVVIVPESSKPQVQVFFGDFNLSQSMPSKA